MGTETQLKLKINTVILNSITGNTMCLQTPENCDWNPGVLQHNFNKIPPKLHVAGGHGQFSHAFSGEIYDFYSPEYF
jgi:hypothetical protein